MGLERSTRASIRCSLRPLQRKAALLWIGRQAQVILASLSLQFKVVSNIPRIMVNAPYVIDFFNFAARRDNSCVPL